MSLENRAKAAAKNVEGKLQEGAGEATGNSEDRAKGKAKQSEAELRNAAENTKDKIKKALD